MSARDIGTALGGQNVGDGRPTTGSGARPGVHQVAATGAIRSELTPLDRVGNYWIDAEGFFLKGRYPENRLAKVLFDTGYRGLLEVYGPSTEGDRFILRYSCDIEKMATRRMSEDDRGIRFMAWTERSLAALKGIVRGRPFTKDAGNDHCRLTLPASHKGSFLSKGSSRGVPPETDAARDALSEKETVT